MMKEGKFNEDLHVLLATVRGSAGSQRCGLCNDNGLLLLRTCVEHRLLLTNTFFCLLIREKATWMQPWSRCWQLLNYVLIRSVFKCSSVISDAAVNWLPKVNTNNDPALLPSLPEYIRDVPQISSGKALGSDTIPPDVYKHGGPRLRVELTTLFQEMWRQGQAPQDFKHATVVHIYKRKGNRQLCDKHRGISLLNISGKIFARILLNRPNSQQEQGLLPESQCGFRRHRETTNMIFATHLLQEKCQEMRTHLYTTFMDLTKACDKGDRDELWKDMHKFGCPERFTHMVRQLHDGMMARVTDYRMVTEVFTVTNGVKQGCLSCNTEIDDEIAQRISKASQAFGRLLAYVWNCHGIHLNTKLKMYKPQFLTAILYGAENWTKFFSQPRKLKRFHISYLHEILKLRCTPTPWDPSQVWWHAQGPDGLYGTPTPWDPSQVWWHAQGRLGPRQPPAPSPISGLLDSVLTPDTAPATCALSHLQSS
ncbi:unnamed protein product [Schistocephalus solidus]|uniref:Reverse transcriptase domain-containing protein n=1 Tax=Schistocephalus solidus TaxID=70667 RepID=A0A183SG81_SCHSO|nr:unnamed protein product [Schistocephalus solidus]